MEIKLSANRHRSGSVFLGIFVLITFLIFGVLAITLSVRCKKLSPRQLPDEDTNAVNHIQVEWFGSTAPTHQDGPSGAFSGRADLRYAKSETRAAHAPSGHTNRVSFPWHPGMETNGWVSILRTEDLTPPVQWTVLHYVWFGDQWVTNVVGTNVFLTLEFWDQYAPAGRSFYKGMVITNR